jgi:hypothetical protein
MTWRRSLARGILFRIPQYVMTEITALDGGKNGERFSFQSGTMSAEERGKDANMMVKIIAPEV